MFQGGSTSRQKCNYGWYGYCPPTATDVGAIWDLDSSGVYKTRAEIPL